MNHKTDDFDDESKPELSRIEQQLKQFRPRAPQLDLNAIAHTPQQSNSVSLSQAAIATTRVGFTATQLATAIAASWLVGAIVGGGCIFCALRPNLTDVATNNPLNRIEPAPANDPELMPTDKNNPLANVELNPLVAEAPTLTVPSQTDARPQSLFNLDFNSLPLDAQLTARGLQESSSFAGASSERYVTTASSRSTDEPFIPTEPSNRSKLMKDFLSNPNFQIQ